MRVLLIEGTNEGQVHNVSMHSRNLEVIKPSQSLIHDLNEYPINPVETTLYRIRHVQMHCEGEADFECCVGMLPDNNTNPAMAYIRYATARLIP